MSPMVDRDSRRVVLGTPSSVTLGSEPFGFHVSQKSGSGSHRQTHEKDISAGVRQLTGANHSALNCSTFYEMLQVFAISQ